METPSIATPAALSVSAAAAPDRLQPPAPKAAATPEELKKAFDNFVGQTFYAQMLAAMRKTVGKPAYFHGGRGEEIFQGQLDQQLVEKLSDATDGAFGQKMYEQFLQQTQPQQFSATA